MKEFSEANFIKMAETVNRLRGQVFDLKKRNQELDDDLLQALYEKEKYRCDLQEFIEQVSK